MLLVYFYFFRKLWGKKNNLSVSGLCGNFVWLNAGFDFLFPLLFILETQGLSLGLGNVAQFCTQGDNTEEYWWAGHILADAEKLTYCIFGCQSSVNNPIYHDLITTCPATPLSTLCLGDDIKIGLQEELIRLKQNTWQYTDWGLNYISEQLIKTLGCSSMSE